MSAGLPSAEPLWDHPAMAATELSVIGICPACGYPKCGPGLCAYCRPAQLRTGETPGTGVLSGLIA